MARIGYKLPQDAEWIQLQAGLMLPTAIVLEMPDQDGFDLEMRVTFDRHLERFVCSEFHMRQREGGPPVTGEAIRSVPIREHVRAAIHLAQLENTGTDEGGVPTAGLRPGVRPPEGLAKRGITDELLDWVSQAYTLAEVINEPPTKSVQDQLGVSRATAGRWVAEARKRGLIEPLNEEDSDGDR